MIRLEYMRDIKSKERDVLDAEAFLNDGGKAWEKKGKDLVYGK